MPVQPIIPPEWGWAYDIAVGQDWPQADEDALRRVAQAWTGAMEGLLTVANGGNAAAQNVNYSVQAISSDEFNNYWSQYVNGDNSAVGQMAQQCENLATQCLAFAEQTEFTKLSIDIQLILLFIQLAIDLVMAFVTFGASTSEGVLAAFITRLTVRGFLTELLKAVLMAVLPDVITQVIMLSEGHRGSFDVGETLQAAQMGVIGGLVGAGLGAGLGKLGTTGFFDSVAGRFLSQDASEFAGGVANAALHGALTNVGTNLAAGGVDSVENQIHAALDPVYAKELRLQTQDQGEADQKSGENPLIAALNGAFTGALFHTVHEGSFALAGNAFGAMPLTLTDSEGNTQRFTALPLGDGGDGGYALFDQSNQLAGKGTVDGDGAITVTPNNGSSYTAQVVTLGDQKFGPADAPGPASADTAPAPGVPTELASPGPQWQPPGPGASEPVPGAYYPAAVEPVSPADHVPGAQPPPAQPVYPEITRVHVDQQPVVSAEQPVVSPEQPVVSAEQPVVSPEQPPASPEQQVPPPPAASAPPPVEQRPYSGDSSGSTQLSAVPTAAYGAVEPPAGQHTGSGDPGAGDWFPLGADHPESGQQPQPALVPAQAQASPLTPRQAEDLEQTPTVPLSWDRPLVFTDTGEAMAYAERVWADAITQLTPEQKAALMAYTGEAIASSGDPPSYQSINRYLRGRIPATPEILDGIARIDEALRLQPVPENMVVNRTTNARVFAGADGNPVGNPADLLGLVGSVQEAPSYLSTHFGAYHPGGEEVALHLAVPDGTPALYLGTISVDPSQHELLLGRGLSFQVDRVWTEPTGLGGETWHVQAHVLPDHPADAGYTHLGAEDNPAGDHAEIQSVAHEDGGLRVTVASGDHTAELRVEIDHEAGRVVLRTDDENGDILRDVAGRVRGVPGMFDVFGHADPDGLLVDGMRLPFRELDKLPLGIPPDAAIRLFGCQAGAGDAIAELARVTGRDVVAADTDVWIDKNGYVIAASAAGSGGGARPDFGAAGIGDGTWQVIHPDGGRETLTIDDPRHPPPPPAPPARTAGGPGWSPDASQQELASRPPRIPPDQFWEERHATQSYVVSYDDSRALYKPETGVWRSPGDATWAGDRLYHEIWQDAHLWAEVPSDDIRYTREIAAYGADRMLGFNLVPTTTEGSFDTVGSRGTGSLQEWVPGSESQAVRNYPPLDQQRMAVLDYVLANSDRHPNNYLTGVDGRPVAIDNGEAFPATSEAGITSQFAGAWLDKPLSPEVLDQVRAVDPGEFREMLLARGITEQAAGGAVARLREIQEDGMITGRAFGGDIHSPPSWFPLGDGQRVIRPGGYQGELFGPRAPASALAQVTDAFARHDPAPVITSDPARAGQWLPGQVDPSRLAPDIGNDPLNQRLRDYAGGLLDKASQLVTYRPFTDELVRTARQQETIAQLTDAVTARAAQVDDLQSRFDQMEKPHAGQTEEQRRASTLRMNQARQELDTAKGQLKSLRQQLTNAISNPNNTVKVHLEVHSIPVDGDWDKTWVRFHSGDGDYPGIVKRLTGLRDQHQATVPDFERRYARALLDLAAAAPGPPRVPQSLVDLASRLYGAGEVARFLQDPDQLKWATAGKDSAGAFLHDAAALMALQVQVEGRRNPAALVTNLANWEMIAAGKVTLQEGLGYLNVMGPVGSVQVGRASAGLTGPDGPDLTVQVAEMEMRQRQILALYAIATGEVRIAEDASGVAALNAYFARDDAIATMMAALVTRLGW